MQNRVKQRLGPEQGSAEDVDDKHDKTEHAGNVEGGRQVSHVHKAECQGQGRRDGDWARGRIGDAWHGVEKNGILCLFGEKVIEDQPTPSGSSGT